MYCDACHQEKDDNMFGSVPGGELYTHLGLTRVCKLCQIKYKTCSNCKVLFPANTIWFYPKKNGKFKTYHICKPCRAVAAAHYNRLRKGMKHANAK